MTTTLDSTAPNEEDVYRFPASFGQQRLWVLDQLEPGSPVYNISRPIRLTGPLNMAALEQSLSEIVRRHESLRTTLTTVEGQPMQVIAPALTLPAPLPRVDLQDLPESVRAERADQLAATEARQPFDLARGPLLRTALLQLGAQEHLLLLTIHHIVADEWSMGVFMRELARLYTAHVRGMAATLPELPIQYADYSLWQQEWLQGEVLEAQLAYWRAQLAGAPAVLELPTDRPRPPVQSFRGATQRFVLPHVLSQALRRLSRQEGVTLFMTLLAAFQVLLARYTGQDDIVVGSPIAGRTRTALEDLMGFFVNTLVLRTDLAGDPTFRELLARVREVTLEAYAHQELPFERLVEELQPARDLSHNPLFQVMFVLQNTPRWTEECAGLTMEEVREVDKGTAKLDLTLYLEETEQGLDGECEYSTDLFEAGTIARLIGHLQTLLEGIVANPGQRLSQLPLLSEAERHQLLVAWNETRAAYPADACLQELFEAQVARTPDAVAVVCAEQRLTYRELNQRANQLAHYLRARGVGPEVRVGLCVERSLEMVVGLLGILKAGGAYVPLDPTYPTERLAFMLQDAQAPVLLTQQHLRGGLPEQGARVVCLDADWEVIAHESSENPLSGATAASLAYVMYTSGSTGQPKGLLAVHRSTVNRLHWMWTVYPFAPAELCCQKTSLSFVDSVCEVFGPLLRGIGTVIIPDAVLKDPQLLIHTLAEWGVTRIVLVPSLLRVLLETSPDLQARLPALTFWISSGEALPLELWQRFRQRLPQSRLLNLYGSSEVAADVTCYDTTEGVPRTCVPIGRPIANTQVYILDRHRQPVPIGVPGELYIGGDGLARGYLHRPELTAERFIPDPFRSEPGARLYRTGDRARYLPDGTIEYLGRLDHQVKVRGFRIELGEIETVLAQHPAVHETVVIVREDAPGDKRLVAYVVPRPAHSLILLVGRNARPSAQELLRYLAERLPEYMVPAAIEVLDALPRMPNQKVDRLALPAPTRSEGAGRHVAPRDELERGLAAIWQRELKIAPIGITDNFFHLGGDSLLAVHLFSAIEKVLGTRLPVVTLFTAQTVEQLAAILRQEGWSPGEDEAALSSDRPTSLLTVRETARGAARTMLHALLKRRL